jgi:hypothetical protein
VYFLVENFFLNKVYPRKEATSAATKKKKKKKTEKSSRGGIHERKLCLNTV